MKIKPRVIKMTPSATRDAPRGAVGKPLGISAAAIEKEPAQFLLANPLCDECCLEVLVRMRLSEQGQAGNHISDVAGR
jgi:hypothetical protein